MSSWYYILNQSAYMDTEAPKIIKGIKKHKR